MSCFHEREILLGVILRRIEGQVSSENTPVVSQTVQLHAEVGFRRDNFSFLMSSDDQFISEPVRWFGERPTLVSQINSAVQEQLNPRMDIFETNNVNMGGRTESFRHG